MFKVDMKEQLHLKTKLTFLYVHYNNGFCVLSYKTMSKFVALWNYVFFVKEKDIMYHTSAILSMNVNKRILDFETIENVKKCMKLLKRFFLFYLNNK